MGRGGIRGLTADPPGARCSRRGAQGRGGRLQGHSPSCRVHPSLLCNVNRVIAIKKIVLTRVAHLSLGVRSSLKDMAGT